MSEYTYISFLECTEAYPNNETDYGGYLCLDEGKIAGHFLDIIGDNMKSKGITPIYLIIDHTGFYKRYGWEFFYSGRRFKTAILPQTYKGYFSIILRCILCHS